MLRCFGEPRAHAPARAGCANSPDYDASWLRWDLQRRVFLGATDWRYRTGEKPQSFLRRLYATTWGVNIDYTLQQWLAERPVAWMFRRQQRRRQRRGLPAIEASSPRGAAMQTEIKMRMFSVIGMAMTYLIWSAMGWIIFTYGSLVYRLMVRTAAAAAAVMRNAEPRAPLRRLQGDQAQQKFTSSWGVGLAISQATQFKDMAIVALQATAVLSIMETFWLVGNRAWLEEHIGAWGACVGVNIAAEHALSRSRLRRLRVGAGCDCGGYGALAVGPHQGAPDVFFGGGVTPFCDAE